MKRILCGIAVCLLLLSVFALTAGAANDPPATYVEDGAGLFFASEKSDLEARCRDLSSRYDTCCLILTTGSLGNEYTDLSDVSDYEFESIIMAYADDYLESVIGAGDENNGIALVIYVNENNASDRGYWISTQGKEVYGFMSSVEQIKSRVKAKLSGEDYGAAASTFLDCVEYVERDGELPEPPKELPSLGITVLCVVIGFVIALIIVLSMKSKMKNVRAASTADNYLVNNSVNIRNRNVIFIRKDVTRTRRESSSSGGGGGSHSSSSGTSHGGGGGRF